MRELEVQHWWLAFGIVCSLLPAYLLVRTVMHVLNIHPNSSRRWRALR
jgi:hypothetical protein